MKATSQNGYPVLFDNRVTGPLPRLRQLHLPGIDRHVYLRDGSAGFLLGHMAVWWHDVIHPLDTGTWDEWGWYVRPIRGATSGYSNHSSGTALDLDATLHPRGVATERGLTAKQIAAIRDRLNLYEGCIRWGGDYKITVDAMHFELVKPIGDVEKRARALLDSPRGKRLLSANGGLRAVILS